MTALPPTTKRRLKKIPQTHGVWEGDRRPLGNIASHLETDLEGDGECIIWVDGTEGSVRAMDIVPENQGIEAVVRTLLRAIESPHHPAQPSRPQKIIVRDREIQFFLRGALQTLDIEIEYVPDLPLIDRLFQGLERVSSARRPSLPDPYAELLEETALRVWEEAPWEVLADSDILGIEIKGCDTETIYLCIMGMMSAEYGVLFYRSLDSLKQFRAAALKAERSSLERMEKAFLAQDCWFLNYEEIDLEEEEFADEDIVEMHPFFGSLHPYEGMRPFLDEEEAKIIYVALNTLLRFCRNYQDELSEETIKPLEKSYRITLPMATVDRRTISTKMFTLPDLTAELLSMGDLEDSSDSEDFERLNIPIQEDLIPDGSLVTLGSIPWDLVTEVKAQKQTYHQSLQITRQGDGLPAILVQTSRPKAMSLIAKLQQAGGVKAICFNPGEDSFTGDIYNLGMLQTGNDELYIFAEYSQEIPQHVQAIDNWYRSCQKIKGYGSLIVAMGVTGSSRGNPQPKDMLAIFEVKAVHGEELGMGMLQLLPSFEFDFD
jgi:hypothetical protein